MNQISSFKIQHLLAGTLCGFLLLPMESRAADEPLEPSSKVTERGGTSSSSVPTRAAEEVPVESSIDEKLLKSLDKAVGTAESDIDRLERAIQGMRDASKRMESADTGKETQQLQTRVVQDLEQLLKQMQQQQKQKQKQNSPQNQNQQQQDRQKLQQQQLDPKNSGSRQPNQAEQDAANQQRRNDPARDAQENVSAAQRARDEEARRQQMVKDVWGHLPPHMREAMMQSFREKYLPQYEDLVRRYYEALAEKNKPRTPGR